MARVDTPKKRAKRGRPSSKAANDCCRLCACNLKVKFGDFKKTTYVSTENLFQSKREGSECNKTLAELCSRMGLHVANSTALSDRVCRPCGREKETPFSCILLLKVVYRGHFLEIHHVRIRQVRIRHPRDSNDSCHPQFRRQIGVLDRKKAREDLLKPKNL